jgi:hypothetical protein
MLGLEVLADSELLARCDLLLGSHTGVFHHAVRRNTTVKKVAVINNGVNSKNFLAARYLYRIKKLLPPEFGGLPGELIELDRDQYDKFFLG